MSRTVRPNAETLGRVRCRVVAYDRFARVYDDGYVTRAQIKTQYEWSHQPNSNEV